MCGVRRERSAVGFLAIADTNDFEIVFPDAEKDPMILRAESELRRIDAGQLTDVALLGFGEAGQSFEDLQSDGLLNAADVGSGLIGPDDALSHCAGVFRPVTALGPSFP